MGWRRLGLIPPDPREERERRPLGLRGRRGRGRSRGGRRLRGGGGGACGFLAGPVLVFLVGPVLVVLVGESLFAGVVFGSLLGIGVARVGWGARGHARPRGEGRR